MGTFACFVYTNPFTVPIWFYGETTKRWCAMRQDEAWVAFVYVEKQAIIYMSNFSYNLNFQHWTTTEFFK